MGFVTKYSAVDKLSTATYVYTHTHTHTLCQWQQSCVHDAVGVMIVWEISYYSENLESGMILL